MVSSVNGFDLQRQIDHQGHQGGILVASGIAGHEKQQKHHHQILGVKILGEQSFQKTPHAGR